MVSTSASGQVTNYSKRFTITGMTGTFTPAISTITGTSGPADILPSTSTTAAAAAAGAATASGGEQYDIAYELQTGATRYAPMASVPPTKIVATNTSPLHPTSAVTYFSTAAGDATIATTITQAQTHSISSRANTAAAASQPTDDMQRFLNRWKD